MIGTAHFLENLRSFDGWRMLEGAENSARQRARIVTDPDCSCVGEIAIAGVHGPAWAIERKRSAGDEIKAGGVNIEYRSEPAPAEIGGQVDAARAHEAERPA